MNLSILFVLVLTKFYICTINARPEPLDAYIVTFESGHTARATRHIHSHSNSSNTSSSNSINSTKVPKPSSHDLTVSDIDADAVIRPLTAPPPKVSSTMYKNTTSSRIAWGSMAGEHQFPYTAFIDGVDYFCSGSIIAPNVVMTAGHCVRDQWGWVDHATMSVFVGNHEISKATQVDVKAIYCPTKYSTATQYGDIALLLLADNVPTTASSAVIALADARTDVSAWDVGEMAVTVAGWGLTQLGGHPNTLRYTTEPVMTIARCDVVHKGFGAKRPADHICFGLGTRPPTGTCGGDSGAPFVVEGEGAGGKGPVQVALVSYGPLRYQCGDAEDNVDAATSVMYWRTWIDGVLAKITHD